MNETSARVIVTQACGRNCPGCANRPGVVEGAEVINNLAWLNGRGFKHVVLTGGEPFLVPEVSGQVYTLDVDFKVYCYSSIWTNDISEFGLACDGLTYTLHFPFTKRDEEHLDKVIERLREPVMFSDSRRLRIDSRLGANYKVNRALSRSVELWDDIQTFKWRTTEECPLPENEKLFILESALVTPKN